MHDNEKEQQKETKKRKTGPGEPEQRHERNEGYERERQRGISIRDELNRLFDQDLWLEPLDFFRRTQRMLSRKGLGAFPKIDVSETDSEVKVVADIPGIDPDDLDIEIHDDWMRISGEIERESEINERPYRYERAYGSFRRGFLLPAKVKREEARAVCKNGILTITIPKVEEERRHKIKIEKQ